MPGWRYAFSLSREAVKAATPPGTVLLIEHGATQQDGRYVDRVAKYPLPTADPADPLNWPRRRKLACMVTLSLYAFVSNFISAAIAPALSAWNPSFPDDRRTIQELMGFVSFNVLLLGLANVFWVPLANIFGRRAVLVISNVILFVATACGTCLKGFNITLAVRIFQGIGSAASETVTPAVVGDLFFVHERGSQMAIYTASLASGSVIGGIVGGYIANGLGWFELFWLSAGLTGISCFGTVFLVPETIYDRGEHSLPIERNLPRPSRYLPRTRTPAPYLSLVTLPSIRLTLPSRFQWSGETTLSTHGLTWYQTSSSGDLSSTSFITPPVQLPKHESFPEPAARSSRAEYPPFTYTQSLRFAAYRGNVWYQFKKPWFTLRLPATWIVMAQYGGLVGGVVVISTVGPQLLGLPPYEWGENTGLLFLGALVGIIFGAVWTGLLADQRLKKRARSQDHGYAEPEARIPIMLPSLAVGTCGLLLFGFCAEYPGQYRWLGLEFAYGMVAFTLTQVPSIWFSYLIDSYNQLASDCFVMICILRGVIPFAWSFFVVQWVQRDGYLIPFVGFTVIMAVFSLLILPVMWFGKRMRIATARYVVGNQ